MRKPFRPIRVLRRLRTPPGWITLSYAVVAALWIQFSDELLVTLPGDGPENWKQWSVVKGMAFVLVTSGLLFLLMRSTYGRMEAAMRALRARDVELRRLGRLNAALSHINQAIVRLPVKEEMFERVCQVLVEHGGFQLAWIGWRNPVTNQLETAGAAGEGAERMKAVRVNVDERTNDTGPTATAFRENRPVVSDRFSKPGAAMEGAPEAAGSFVALPVRDGDRVGGVLHVCSGEAELFGARDMALLTEATSDVAFALDNLAREEERHRAEAAAESERTFSDTMIESMPGVLYLYDTNGRFLRWNKNFERVSGYGAAEVARMHPLEFFAVEHRPDIERKIREVFDCGESSVEAPFRAKDGRTTPYFFTGRCVELDGRQCLVGVGIDISERKAAEAALRELNANLEHKVVERTEELRASLVRAEAADRIKSAFLATMSHELRTPLNSIIGFTGIVLQGLAGPLNAEQSKQLGMVRGSARHLLELINDVLDLSKIEAGQLEVRREPFHLREALERAAATVRPLAEKKGLELVTRIAADLGEVIGDRRRVEQVALNLLNNAVKFTETGRVTLEAARRGDGTVRVCVADTGIGIKPADLASLFVPFRQVDSGLSRQHDGTGLGLAICRRLVTLMGGEIDATSEWGRGSEFVVLLPLQPVATS